MSSLHVLEKLSLNIGHLSCIYYPFLACKRLVSVLLKIEIDQLEKRKLNQVRTEQNYKWNKIETVVHHFSPDLQGNKRLIGVYHRKIGTTR